MNRDEPRTLSKRLVSRLILWARRRDGYRTPVVAHGGHDLVFYRWAPFYPDEWDGKNLLPWWRPFNVLLHCWRLVAGQCEEMHDHPRWSITVCLRGQLIERTPWGERLLTPGSIVIRSRKAIHGFEVPAGFRGKTWTLFIVGRRKHRQNTYRVTRR